MLPHFTVACHAELDSTNLEALRRARAGAAGGLVVTADRQTAGRGTHGREWRSPPGNLYLSLLLRPDLEASALGELSFVTALAVADAADSLLPGPKTALKWPNDVLIDGAKVAGVLVEIHSVLATEPHEASLRAQRSNPGPLALSVERGPGSPRREAPRDDGVVIVGVGINVAWAPRDTPYPATSLAAHGGTATVDQARDAFLSAFRLRWDEWRAQGFARIRQDWVARAWRLGGEIAFDDGRETIRGVFAGVADDGGLLLATRDGERRVRSGRLSYIPASHEAA